MLDHFDLIRSLKFLPGILIGLTVHEFCHAWMSHRCGDTTAKEMGRVTLNPLKHIDPLGFLMLLLVGFGWAKPVQFNPQNLRNPKYDVIKIALAGPFSNAIIAMILSCIFSLVINLGVTGGGAAMQTTLEIFIYAIFINWGLFVFNLIPLPPLDGSHIFFFPLRKYPKIYYNFYRYGTYILFALIILSNMSDVDFLPIGPAIRYLTYGFLSLVGCNLTV
jgi:Zn-dependent protease